MMVCTRCTKCDIRIDHDWFIESSFCREPNCPVLGAEARMWRARHLGRVADQLAEVERDIIDVLWEESFKRERVMVKMNDGELRCPRELALRLGASAPVNMADYRAMRDAGWMLVRDPVSAWPLFWPVVPTEESSR